MLCITALTQDSHIYLGFAYAFSHAKSVVLSCTLCRKVLQTLHADSNSKAKNYISQKASISALIRAVFTR